MVNLDFAGLEEKEDFSPVEQLEKYIEENKIKKSIMSERFPSIEYKKKLANEHALPLTNMLTCES